MKKPDLSVHRTQVFVFGFLATLVAVLLFLRVIIGPILVAMIAAYIINPWLEQLERRGIKRSLSSLVVIVVAVLLLLVAAWIMLPVLFSQIRMLAEQLPTFKKYIEEQWLPPINAFLSTHFGRLAHNNRFRSLEDIFVETALPDPSTLLVSLGQSTRFLAHLTLATIVAPPLTYYIIRNSKRLFRTTIEFVPPDLRKGFLSILREFDDTLRSVLQGQILVITLLSAAYSIAFSAAGMPLGFAVGFVTGIVRIVPYMDLLIGGSLSFLVLATHPISIPTVVGVITSFGLIQLLDVFFITPKIVGKFSGIHPFILIILVLAFGDWLGFIGVLLAIPMAAVGRIATSVASDAYKSSDFFHNHREKHNEVQQAYFQQLHVEQHQYSEQRPPFQERRRPQPNSQTKNTER